MIRIEEVEIAGLRPAIRGMRNPKNSWDKSDSIVCKAAEGFGDCPASDKCQRNKDYGLDVFCVGENDLTLMERLTNAGTDHRKFMRMIAVYADITAPMYWWKEADTYKVGTVRNSCSTMHTITNKEFTLDDFSHEQLMNNAEELKEAYLSFDSYGYSVKDVLGITISVLNYARQKFLETQDKRWWWQIIQLLPSSYNQKSTVMLNYEVLTNMYHARKNHKLDEWRDFCKWIETLPYAKELIIGNNDK